MAKGSRGGQRAGGVTSGGASLQQNTQQAQPQQLQQANVQVDDTSTASAFSAEYDAFMAMSDDEKAHFIAKAIRNDVPAHLAQNDFQRFIYNSGLNDKPDVVDDATLDKMTGTELFRTVNSVYDSDNDISYNANQIAKQVMSGKVTRVSDNGGSAYGRGIYFADDYGESTGYYGKTTGDVKKTAVMRAKFNSNAKVITDSIASRGVQTEISKGTKLGKILARVDYHSQASIYAMARGYNVIDAHNGTGYFVILNRNAITMSSSVKPKGSKW